MSFGKLSPSELHELLGMIGHRREEVLSGSSVGEDCAVLKCDDFILLTSDPITAETSMLGELAIHISANDIYASGGEPVAAMLTIIASPDTPLAAIAKTMKDAEDTARALDLEITGGHTEWSDSVVRQIAVVTMLGTTKKPVASGTLKPGDLLLMTKSAAYEGTAILADAKAARLKDVLSEQEAEFAKGLIRDLSVRNESRIAREHDVSAMHDITEGGVFGAVAEICEAGGVGAVLDVQTIPVHPVTRKICSAFGADPYKMISSGSLLIAAEPKTAQRLLAEYEKAGISCSVIGHVEGSRVVAKDGEKSFEIAVEKDELFRL